MQVSSIRIDASGMVTKQYATSIPVTLAAGPSISVAGAIPAGARLIGVSSVVTSDIGVSNGTTGYKLGLDFDPERWGAVIGTAIGSGISNQPIVAKAPLDDQTGGAIGNILAPISAGEAYSQADLIAIRNAIASIASLTAQNNNFYRDTAIVLTATGGNFDGAGVVTLSVRYETTHQSGYVY